MVNKKKAFISSTTLILLSASLFSSDIASPVVAAKKSKVSIEKTSGDKKVLYQNSFEEGETEGFKESILDQEKGMANVNGLRQNSMIGDVTHLVVKDSIKGSKNYNDNETKEKLFDKSTSTKFLTNENEGKNIWISFELKEAKTISSYSLTSANDAKERDPKDWTFYGSANGEDWIVLDEQDEQVFDGRLTEKIYQLQDAKEYKFYKLEIKNNHGATMTQFSELNLATGNEADEIRPENDNMQSKISTGPASSWNQMSNVGWSGKKALEISGTHLEKGAGHAYNEVFDVDIPVTDNTHLSYVIFPSLTNEEKYDYSYTSMHAAIDLRFTDGTYLSDLGSVDKNGNVVSPEEQGKSRVLTYNQWNKVTTQIGEVAKGKIVDKILVGYEDSAKDSSKTFLTYFDDVEISNYDEEFYEEKADYVNILRGTNDSGGFSRGLTAPAVTVPHGFNFWVPVTESGSNKMYNYQQNADRKFQHMTVSHEPSIWVGDRGTWQFMVNSSIDINKVASKDDISNKKVASSFSHDNETAKAHYYSLSFDKDTPAAGTKIEVTPSEHASITRFTFTDEAAYHNVVFDSVRADGSLAFEGNNAFSAYTDHTGNGMKRMYVYGEFSESFEKSNIQNKKQGIVSFSKETPVVEMKVATSFISVEQAKKNLELEVAEHNFDSLFKATKKQWNKELDRLDIEGATKDQLVTVYSNMYRLMAYPNNYSENTGSKDKPNWKYSSPFSGTNDDPKIMDGKLYINNGFWDTYRTAWSAYSLFTPSKYEEMLDGLVQHYHDNTWVPRWIAPGGTNSMVGTSSDIIFGDAIMKGAKFDQEGAYKSAIKNASVVSTNLTGGGRKQLDISNFIGYVPMEKDSHGFSWSIEGYINDFGLAQMAEKLGHKDEAAYYRNRALNYALLFDKQDTATNSWFKGKYIDGSWSTSPENFNPISWERDYTETNAYNMAVSVPQDGQGLANLYGGREGLAEKIDSILNTPGDFYNGSKLIHEMLEAREVKLGQYGHSNQPSHHILYMYNYAGQPWKTQKYVRDIMARAYVGSDFGQGYIGDEDNGEMSAWYLFSALGFYPLNLASNEYVIGSPLFEKATLHLENGKDLVVNAPDNSKENIYVNSVKLNGKDHSKVYFTHEELSQGAVIDFEMSATPNKEWGSNEEDLPKSLTEGDEVPAPIQDMMDSSVKISEKDTAEFEDILISNNKGINALIDNTSGTTADIKDESVIYHFRKPQKVEMFTLTSGEKDIRFDEIKLEASNDGKEWTELDNRNQIDFEWKQYTRPFMVNEDKQGEYSYYRLSFKGQGKLAEIELLGNLNSKIERTDLELALRRAKEIDQKVLEEPMLKLLTTAINNGETVYNNEKSSDQEIEKAYEDLLYAIGSVDSIQSGYKRIEAENYSEKHSGVVNDGENIGGVKVDYWTRYNYVDFSDYSPNFFEISYSGQPKDTCKDAHIEVYLDKMEGEPVFTIDTAPTTGWTDYQTASVMLSEEQSQKLTGVHDVILKFKGTGLTYVANVDWFKFTKKIVVETSTDSNGNVSPIGKLEKEALEPIEFTLMPNEGFVVDGVEINGEKTALSENDKTFVLNGLKQDAVVVFLFKEKSAEEIPVESVTITTPLSTLKIGGKLQLEVNVKPENSTDKKVQWSVEKEEVASIDENGIVTGLKTGMTRVTAISNNGKKAVFMLRVTK